MTYYGWSFPPGFSYRESVVSNVCQAPSTYSKNFRQHISNILGPLLSPDSIYGNHWEIKVLDTDLTSIKGIIFFYHEDMIFFYARNKSERSYFINLINKICSLNNK
jgi:hypothetical protein